MFATCVCFMNQLVCVFIKKINQKIWKRYPGWDNKLEMYSKESKIISLNYYESNSNLELELMPQLWWNLLRNLVAIDIVLYTSLICIWFAWYLSKIRHLISLRFFFKLWWWIEQLSNFWMVGLGQLILQFRNRHPLSLSALIQNLKSTHPHYIHQLRFIVCFKSRKEAVNILSS